MKLNNLQKDLYIFFLVIISIIVATLLWEKISLPLNNTIEASGFAYINAGNKLLFKSNAGPLGYDEISGP